MVDNRQLNGTLGIPSLKALTKLVLDEDIQTGEHSSVEDARAAMKIFKLFEKNWLEYTPLFQKKVKKHVLRDAPPIGETIIGLNDITQCPGKYFCGFYF